MIKVIDYQDNYSTIIDSEEKNYWGRWDKTSIKDLKDKYNIFKIVLKDDDYAGHLYGKMIGDLPILKWKVFLFGVIFFLIVALIISLGFILLGGYRLWKNI